MMRLTLWLRLLLVALVACGLSSCADRAEVKSVKPVKEWDGKFAAREDEPLEREAPESGYIANEKAWAKLWKAWRSEEELPKVNFEKQLALVVTVGCAHDQIQPSFVLDGKRNLKNDSCWTAMDGPGFAYRILVVERAGIKTYNGKAIARE
jgi:hypothetical protein